MVGSIYVFTVAGSASNKASEFLSRSGNKVYVYILRRPQKFEKISHHLLKYFTNIKAIGRSFQIFVAFSEKLNFNRTRCRSLVMLYYLYTMRRWLSHSGVELPCLVFTTAQRCQSIYKVAFLFCQCEFAFHLYYSKNQKNDKI